LSQASSRALRWSPSFRRATNVPHRATRPGAFSATQAEHAGKHSFAACITEDDGLSCSPAVAIPLLRPM